MSNIFIEQHNYDNIGTNSILLTFIKSLNVQVYPCGRRRSEIIDKDGKSNTVSDRYQIPFDPEARLNTELNNRKQVSSNGYTQNYINELDIDKKLFSLAIGGYTFTINLADISEEDYINSLGNQIIESLKSFDSDNQDSYDDSTRIYANIKLEEVPLFDGFTKYNTWILRNQSMTNYASNELDLLSNKTNTDISDASNYYFSGLSFSTKPIEPFSEQNQTYSEKVYPEDNESRAQHNFSLCILSKESETWKLFESSKLPHIEHGERENSIKVGHLDANSINYKNTPIALFEVVPLKNTYQLHLYTAEAE